VAIHAAARTCFTDLDAETLAAITKAIGWHDWVRSLPKGAVVATAVLAETHRTENVTPDLFGDYRPGRWAWRLAAIRPVVPPMAARGRQIIGWGWTVPEGMI
jgi:hypothetical protein